MYAVIRATKTYLRASGARLAAVGLQPGQDILLHQLWDNNGLSQSELIQRLGVEPPTVAKALRRLEKEELISRRRDSRDARVYRVFVTERGRALRDRVHEIWDGLERQATRGFSSQERKLLRQLAARVRENFEIGSTILGPIGRNRNGSK